MMNRVRKLLFQQHIVNKVDRRLCYMLVDDMLTIDIDVDHSKMHFIILRFFTFFYFNK